MRILPLVFVLLACSPPPVGTRSSDLSSPPLCDGATDDRAVMQMTLDAGQPLVIPPGRCLVGRGGGYCGLHAPAGASISGQGSVVSALVQGVVPGSVRLICTDGPGVSVNGLELDGMRSTQVPDEHRAGVFATFPGLTVTDVYTHDFTGDGLTFHTGADSLVVTGVVASSNGRSGLAFTGCSDGAELTDVTSGGNAVKALHTEPGAGCSVDDVHVHGGRFTTGSADWAVSVAGGGVAVSSGWTIDGAVIAGGVYVAGASDVTVSHSTVSNVGSKPAVLVYRNSDRVSLVGNVVSAEGAPAVIETTGTDPLDVPDHVSISGNTVSTHTVAAMGIHATSTRGLNVSGNTIVGANVPSPYAYGIYARSIVAGTGLTFSATNNVVSDWGSVGIEVADTGGGISSSLITGNSFSTTGGSMRYGIGGTYSQSGNAAGPGVTLTAP